MDQLVRQTQARPVRQARSRRTLNAFLDGLDRLLRDRPFESITVVELARAAGVSTGAFYARFKSKEDLLPELYFRFQESLEEAARRDLDPTGWSPLSAGARLERIADYLCNLYENRAWLLRAMVVYSRRRYSHDTAPPPQDAAQVSWLRRLADCLDAEPSPWPGLARDDLEFAVYTATTMAREAILFPNLPMASSLGLDATVIRSRLPALLQSNLVAVKGPDR